MKIYFLTGAAGFIGTNFVKYMLDTYGKNIKLIVFDKLTYAGNLENLRQEIEEEKIIFIKGDIRNQELVQYIFQKYDIDFVVNFAAESHVDRSIEQPQIFLETNILGTQNLLEVVKKSWMIGKDGKGYPIYKAGKKYLQISTDEVYGTLKRDYSEPIDLILEEAIKKLIEGRDEFKTYGKHFFTEKTSLKPRSPYSSSKASADLIVMAYYETYKLPVNITRCSNNYGPYQFPEKLIPLLIKNILEGKQLPIYGDGSHVRDWLYVKDHCKAIDMVLKKGKLGEVYNIGGFHEEENLNIIKYIMNSMLKIIEKEGKYQKILKTELKNINEGLIVYVRDRLGHDERYAVDPAKIIKELGWYPETTFEKGIELTILWYFEHRDWLENFIS